MTSPAVIFKCATHLGYKRHINEDAYMACPELGLWVVADGMGGHNNGSVASQLAVEQINLHVKNGASLVNAIQHSHLAILQAGQKNPFNQGMGCTVVALKLIGQDYEIAAVGDSRAYLWGNAHLTQLTHDHTLVQSLINQGIITDEQAKIHPNRNVLTQALGSTHHDEMAIDVLSGKLHPTEQLLLCTDGLTNRVNDAKIADLLAKQNDIETTVENLIQAALAAGGQDNITAVLLRLC